MPQRGRRRGDMLRRQGQALGRRSSRGVRGSGRRCLRCRRGRRLGCRRRVSQRCAAAHEQHCGVRDHADGGAAGRVVLGVTGREVRRCSARSTKVVSCVLQVCAARVCEHVSSMSACPARCKAGLQGIGRRQRGARSDMDAPAAPACQAQSTLPPHVSASKGEMVQPPSTHLHCPEQSSSVQARSLSGPRLQRLRADHSHAGDVCDGAGARRQRR